MTEEKCERGLVCLFCGEGFGYSGQEPDEATLQAACDHEAQCPDNPYKAEIAKLRAMLSRAVQYTEARDGRHGDLLGCSVPTQEWDEWCDAANDKQ